VERTHHVADGVLHRRQPPAAPDVAVDSPSWFAWLDDPATRSFSLSGPAGTLTARKERRGGAGEGYWTAYRKRDGKLRKTYIGKAEKVTQHRLDEAARFLAESGTDMPPNEKAVHGKAPISSSATVEGDPLLLSKLSVPVPRRTLVPRSSLSGRIEEGLERKLTVVSAPAGFWKVDLAEYLGRSLGGRRPSGRVALLGFSR
jgi:LuxR family transcriptional regulator, maltose regulon positive regulatory protein